MKSILATAALVVVLGGTVRADEMDRDTKSRSVPAVAAAHGVAGGSELDRESPDQSHGWRGRHVWYGGYGFGVSYYPAFYPAYSYRAFGPVYGGSWHSGYSVSYFQPVRYGHGWHRGCW